MPPVAFCQQPSELVTDPRKYLTCIHGGAGVGKTTFGSQIPGHYFVITEAGTQGVRVFGHEVTTWDEFLNTCASLIADQRRGWKTADDQPLREIKVLVVDTLENLFAQLDVWLCANRTFIVDGVAKRFQRIADVPWGKGYKAACEEFTRPLNKLVLLGFGIILISHTKQKAMKWKGQDVTHFGLNLPPSCAEAIENACGAIGHFVTEEHTARETDGTIQTKEVGRFSYWQGTLLRVAKHRLRDFPEKLKLNNKLEEGPSGYENYLEAFEIALKLEQERLANPNCAETVTETETE